MDRDRLVRHLRALEGERHPVTSPEALARAQAYVHEALARAGWVVELDELPDFNRRCANVIAAPRTRSAAPRLVVGAHVDSVSGTPGADDNASGVAVLLEAARVIAASRPDAPVEFVGFALEEPGLIGSRHHAERLRQSRTRLAGMLSLEMVGYTESEGRQDYPPILKPWYPKVGDFLAVVGNMRSCRLARSAVSAMRTVPNLPVQHIMLPGNGRLIPASRLSDHAPFWDAGYRALLLTDTAFLRNPHYHRSTDTVATLDLEFLERVCRGVVELIDRLTRSSSLL